MALSIRRRHSWMVSVVSPSEIILLLHLVLGIMISNSVSIENVTVESSITSTTLSTTTPTKSSSSSSTTTIKPPTTFPTTTTALVVPTSFPAESTKGSSANENRSPTTFPSPGSTESRVPTSFVTSDGRSSTKGNDARPSEFDANTRVYVQLNTVIDKDKSNQNETLQLDENGDARFISLISQLTALCGISEDRIENILVYDRSDINNNDKVVVRFSIAPDKATNPSSADALAKLLDSVNSNTVILSLLETDTVLVITSPIYSWADTSRCPTTSCGIHGHCNADLSGTRSCVCATNYTGVQCETEMHFRGDSNPLLALIVIPVVIVLIVAIVLIVLYVRRERRQEKEKSMMSDPGVRNQVFHNTIGKSYSVAFNETAFNAPQTSEFNDFVEPPTIKSFNDEDY